MAMHTSTFWVTAMALIIFSCSSANSNRGRATGSDSTDVTDGSEVSDGNDATESSTDTTDSADSATTATDSVDGADTTDGSEASDSTDAADNQDVSDASDSEDTADISDVTDATDGVDATDETDGSDASDVVDSTDASDSTDGTMNPTTCGGSAEAECGEGEYCQYSSNDNCGLDGDTGVCKAIPEECPEIIDPVCGCDGVTYDNKCVAAQAGVSVAKSESCEDTKGCGGIAGLTCDTGTFCSYTEEAMCGAGDMMGECQPKPKQCPAILLPVCGCDGEMYDNACLANGAGTSVAPMESCEATTPDGSCGGPSKLKCALDEYCEYPEDDACGDSGALGTCMSVPNFCPAIFLPVCGCDGQQYSNDCMANSVGVSVSDDDTCLDDDPPTPAFCGGFAGFTCPPDSFCSYPLDANCGAGDMPGACKPKPESCDEPGGVQVCGCDGQFYSSACEASLAGVSIAPGSNCSF